MKIHKDTIMLFKALNYKQVLTFPIRKYALTFLSIVTILSNIKYSIAFPGKGDLEVDVFHVGQGNCVLIKVPYEQKKQEKFEYMFVDAGTSEAVKMIDVDKAFSIKKNKVSSSKPTKSDEPSSPPSTKKPFEPKKIKEEHSDLIIKILNKTKQQPQDKSITIKSFLITHPDMDHYSLLPKFFAKDILTELDVEDLAIENIILGGLPSSYYYKYKSKDDNSFIKTLKNLYEKQTNIYFSAIGPLKKISNFKTDFDSILLKEYNHQFQNLINNTSFFKEAFYFKNKSFEINLFFANALHMQQDKKIVIRLADDACPFSLNKKNDLSSLETLVEESGDSYSNNDSIVLKFSFNEKSMLLTGDATGLVTNRIASDPNIDSKFLKTDVLLAAHHGASTHNSNNEDWLKQVSPKCVIISNGLKYGHPNKNAYNSFKSSSDLIKNLGKSGDHWELVASPNKDKTYVARKTFKAIFSTLTNGDININFPSNKNDLTITTFKGKEYEIKSKKEEKKSKEETSDEENSGEESYDEDTLNESIDFGIDLDNSFDLSNFQDSQPSSPIGKDTLLSEKEEDESEDE